MAILSGKRYIRRSGLVNDTHYPIVEESWEIAHSMNGPAEVSSMVNEGVRETP